MHTIRSYSTVAVAVCTDPPAVRTRIKPYSSRLNVSTQIAFVSYTQIYSTHPYDTHAIATHRDMYTDDLHF